MFVFSDQHAWQGNSAVQQVLVFPNLIQKLLFDAAFAKNLATSGVDYAEDTGIGAIYKLRAVQDSGGNFVPLIRCGVTSEQLWESYDRCKTSEEALQKCIERLKQHITSSLTTLSFSIS